MKRLASLLLCVFALNVGAQTILDAPGLAAFKKKVSGGGGGGGGCTPSYANNGGTGVRTSIIAVTANCLSFSGGNTAQLLVDGNISNNKGFFTGQALSGSVFIKFDFGSGNSVLITEATYKQQTTTAQGTWQWQGSNDNSTWTNIGSSFALGGATVETITALSGNTTRYRYYQIIGVSGSTSSAPWIYQFDFKICGI